MLNASGAKLSSLQPSSSSFGTKMNLGAGNGAKKRHEQPGLKDSRTLVHGTRRAGQGTVETGPSRNGMIVTV